MLTIKSKPAKRILAQHITPEHLATLKVFGRVFGEMVIQVPEDAELRAKLVADAKKPESPLEVNRPT